MRRVQANVRTVVERLTAMHYTFGMPRGPRNVALMGAARPRNVPGLPARALTPPSADIHDQIGRFERQYAVLPLSLRMFYEVVGEVHLIGAHPTLAPPDGPVAADPLVVYALDDGLVDDDEEEDGGPSVITIAPDDLHKANISGGDPYQIGIPDLRADGELLNERHRLLFVDYLRLCFRFGGFPGYNGAAEVRRRFRR